MRNLINRKNVLLAAVISAVAFGILAAVIFTVSSGRHVPAPASAGPTATSAVAPFLPTAGPGTTAFSAPIVPPGREAISESNATNIAELARFGRGWPAAIAYSPDGSELAMGTALGIEILQTNTNEFGFFYASDSPILAVLFSPDGRWIAVGRQDGRVLVLDAKTGKVSLTLIVHTRPIHGLAFSRPEVPGGASAWLASGAEDGSVVVWDLSSGMARNKFLNPLLGYWGYGIRSLAFSPDNKVLVTGGDQGYVSRWDLSTGEELPRWQTQHGLLFNIAFSPDGALRVERGMVQGRFGTGDRRRRRDGKSLESRQRNTRTGKGCHLYENRFAAIFPGRFASGGGLDRRTGAAAQRRVAGRGKRVSGFFRRSAVGLLLSGRRIGGACR